MKFRMNLIIISNFLFSGLLYYWKIKSGCFNFFCPRLCYLIRFEQILILCISSHHLTGRRTLHTTAYFLHSSSDSHHIRQKQFLRPSHWSANTFPPHFPYHFQLVCRRRHNGVRVTTRINVTCKSTCTGTRQLRRPDKAGLRKRPRCFTFSAASSSDSGNGAYYSIPARSPESERRWPKC